jgi:hypothetical protein
MSLGEKGSGYRSWGYSFGEHRKEISGLRGIWHDPSFALSFWTGLK